MNLGPLTPEQAAGIRDDPGKWARLHGMLLNESTRELFRMVRPNVLQRRAFAIYRERMLHRRPCRMIILKPRGRGGSSAAGIVFYHHSQNFNTFGGMVGTTDAVAENLREFILKPLAKHDDFPGWSPKITKDVQGELRWEHGSIARCFTANNPESARSARLQAYWASEVGRWPVGGKLDGFETLLSMTGSLPKTGFHLAMQESTPNGSTGAFAQFWNMARWPEAERWWAQWQGDSPQVMDEFEGDLQWIRIFAAWFEFEDAFKVLTPQQVADLRNSLTESEKALIKAYGNQGPSGQLRLGREVDRGRTGIAGLTQEVIIDAYMQLAWRRAMIKSECKGSEDKFDQEYPRDPRSCFLASGSPIFDLNKLTEHEHRAMLESWQRGNLMENGGAVIFVPDENGWFMKRDEPEPGKKYLISADPAGFVEPMPGVDRDAHSILGWRAGFTDEAGHDWCDRMICRIVPPSQVNSEVMGWQLERMSAWLGGAIVANEINGKGGGALLEQLRKREIPFVKRSKINPTHGTITLLEGWETTDRSRREIIDGLDWALRNDEIDLGELHLINQCKTFVRKANGREEADDRCHDDDVLSAAIAKKCMPFATEFRRPERLPFREAKDGYERNEEDEDKSGWKGMW